MERIKRTELADLGEFGLIEHITRGFELRQSTSVKGIGDDAALIDNGDMLTVVTTDLLTEGVHFDLAYMPLKHLGYKAVVVNLSDIYAMNAKPQQITVSIAVSNRFSVEALDDIYEGIKAACYYYDVDLIGGDTTSSLKGLTISITAIGKVAKGKQVLRSGAKVGDLICVSGDLGAAYAGLQLMEREKQLFMNDPTIKPDLENQAYIVGRQLKPEARRDIIEVLEKVGLQPTSMIDVSDGLASELMHICKASGTGALIEEDLLPVRNETYEMVLKFQVDSTTAALNGGEDYELLFTVDPKDIEKARYLTDISIIGEIVPAEDGIRLQSRAGKFHPIKAQGWKHF